MASYNPHEKSTKAKTAAAADPRPLHPDPHGTAERLHAAADAAGLRTFVSHTRDDHRVNCGLSWVSYGLLRPSGREEGKGTRQNEASTWEPIESHKAGDLTWALDVLRTGRTVEVGPGIGLRPMQNAVHVHYETVDYPMDGLEEIVSRPEDPWNLDPDYQRGHVWTPRQRSLFLGNFLVHQRMPLVFINCGDKNEHSRFEIVDGKQRITSILLFTRGEIPAFLPVGPEEALDARPVWWRDFDEVDRRCAPWLHCARVYLPTRAAVLAFYINLNAAGKAHTDEEIDRVRALHAAELAKVPQ